MSHRDVQNQFNDNISLGRYKIRENHDDDKEDDHGDIVNFLNRKWYKISGWKVEYMERQWVER